MTAENHDQVRSTLVKDLNFLFRNPRLSKETKEVVLDKLREIVEILQKAN